jgi:hypothetical protein
LFAEALPIEDQRFYVGHRGLGNSQKAEVAWLDKMGHVYEEMDVHDFGMQEVRRARPLGAGGGQGRG